MPSYAYQAVGPDGRRRSGFLDAPSEQEADRLLVQQGLYVIAVSERRAAPGRTRWLRISRRDLITLTVHLATVLSGGVPLIGGLKDFAEETESVRLKQVARSIQESVQGGAALSEALARLPGVFPEVYVSMVRAGEETGRVDAVLFDLVGFLEWQDGLVSQIRAASTYPLMLLSAVTGLLAVLVLFVLPRFVQSLSRANIALPAPTRAMLATGEFIREYWSLLLLAGVAGYLAFRAIAGTPGGRYGLDRLKLSVPVVGEVLRRIALGRFSRTLQALYQAGVDFVAAMTVVERVVGNSVLSRAIREAREGLIAGMSLSAALRATGEFPPLVLRMVATGEGAGTLDQTLKRVTEYYEREVPVSVRRLFTVVESLTYVLLGAIVFLVAFSLYSPIYSMFQNLRVAPRF